MKKWRKIIIKISDHYADFEDLGIQKKLAAYTSMKGQYGWEVHTEMLMLIRGAVAEEMLSMDFTELPATEKDVQQRAYAMVDELIMFLLNPLAKAEQRARFIRGINREMTKRK